MFKAITLTLGILFLCGVGMSIFPIRQKDYDLYNELLKSSNPEKKQSFSSYSQQKREGVRKQIWYQDDSPLYFRIDSKESELFFFSQDNQIEVIEQLTNVSCIMQEELYYEGTKPMQKIRYLEAEQACYNYNSHLFIGEGVKLWHYQMEGHTPPPDPTHLIPLMHATANSVEFSLDGKKLDFTAHQMRATVNKDLEKIL